MTAEVENQSAIAATSAMPSKTIERHFAFDCPPMSGSSCGAILLLEFASQLLADSALGQLREEANLARLFVARQVLTAPSNQVIGACGKAATQYDGSNDALAPSRVRSPEYESLHNCRMPIDRK